MKAKSSLFLLLSVFNSLIFSGLSTIFAYFIQNRVLHFENNYILIAFSFILLYFWIILFTIILTSFLGRNYIFQRKFTLKLISIFFMISFLYSKFFFISWKKIQNSFISLNNDLVLAIKEKIRNKEGRAILILLPHCIQISDCKIRVTHDIRNCKKCGRCNVGDLLEISEKYNIAISIATGGTLARKIIKEIRPNFILAVACERDLTSGIIDVYPMNVYGVLNQRPKGPCVDTIVDTKEIDRVISEFI